MRFLVNHMQGKIHQEIQDFSLINVMMDDYDLFQRSVFLYILHGCM